MYLKNCLFFILLFSSRIFAQDAGSSSTLDSILNHSEKESEKNYVFSTFKSPKVIMSHSLTTLPAGVLHFSISHRFGTINEGIRQFFGMDEASIRLGLDYGISHALMAGIGRSSYQKNVDVYFKIRLLRQNRQVSGMPIFLSFAGGAVLNTLPASDDQHTIPFIHRLSYFGQVLMGKEIGDYLSVQFAPIFLHRNEVPKSLDPDNTFALETGTSIHLSHRLAFTIDYYFILNKEKSLITYNPLSIGMELETGGHVFQVYVSNAIGMNEKTYLTQTSNNWLAGGIQLGFTITRAFQIKKRNI